MNLPSDAEPPTVLKLDINAMPIMDVTLRGPQSLEALTDFADDVLRERLFVHCVVEGVTDGWPISRRSVRASPT